MEAVKRPLILMMAISLLATPGVIATEADEQQEAERPCRYIDYRGGLVPVAVDPDRCYREAINDLVRDLGLRLHDEDTGEGSEGGEDGSDGAQEEGEQP